MKFFRGLLFLFVFTFILFVIYGCHISFFKVNVVFYAALFDVGIAAVLALAVIVGLPYFRCFNGFEVVSLFSLCLLFGYSLAITGPTLIDRSLSFYILEKLQQRGGGILEANIPQVFTEEYVREAKLVEVRLTEALESGTIIISEGCVRLTSKGSAIASFGQYFRKNWLPKERLLMGIYSDALVDPFKRSNEPSPTYTCQ